MGGAALPVIITAAASVVTTLVATFYAPSWKGRIEAARARRQRSDELLQRYAEPLVRAAFELQSRLYNIHRKSFVTSSSIPEDYRRLSTAWLFGQFLAWMEIVRRETQGMDYGDVRRTARLQRCLFNVSDILASNTIPDKAFRIFRAEQRAIGELMVIYRTAGNETRRDSMGYAEFVAKFTDDDPFSQWFDSLLSSSDALKEQKSDRVALIQRSLIDLIDFLDAERIRFPEVNERGKVDAPGGFQDRKRLRPANEIARFRSDGDPGAILVAWAEEHRISAESAAGEYAVKLPAVGRSSRTSLLARRHQSWFEISLQRAGKRGQPRISTRQATLVNELLTRLGRPPLLRVDRWRGWWI